MFLAIAAGVGGGAVSGYLLSKVVALNLSKRSSSPRVVLACAAVGVLLILLPAFFLSIVVGGNLGGAWGEAVTSPIGFGTLGVPIGLALGLAIILGAGLASGALLGSLLGWAITCAWPQSTPR